MYFASTSRIPNFLSSCADMIQVNGEGETISKSELKRRLKAEKKAAEKVILIFIVQLYQN